MSSDRRSRTTEIGGWSREAGVLDDEEVTEIPLSDLGSPWERSMVSDGR